VFDFRLWLHDIELVRASGEQVPFTLDESRVPQTATDRGAWQCDGVVLLDFEDATGSCTGTSETNFDVAGAAPAYDDCVGVVFKGCTQRAQPSRRDRRALSVRHARHGLAVEDWLPLRAH
jgi:hypothetical protein